MTQNRLTRSNIIIVYNTTNTLTIYYINHLFNCLYIYKVREFEVIFTIFRINLKMKTEDGSTTDNEGEKVVL